MTPTEKKRREALAHIVSGMLAYRGHSSPEALERSYAPAKSPYSGKAVRRLIDGTDDNPGDEMKLMRVAGMLRMPPLALVRVWELDTGALTRLDWKGETDVAQFVTEAVREITRPPRDRRATDTKRSTAG